MQRSLCLACICVSGPSSECARCPDIDLYLFEFVSIFAFVFVFLPVFVFVSVFVFVCVSVFASVVWPELGMCKVLRHLSGTR